METEIDTFEQFGLRPELMQVIDTVGYEMPTPIQVRTIPLMLEGRDVIGQAQTGTGKTAAFALPILQNLNPHRPTVQALVLTPTRELGIQVAEAFQTYSKHMAGKGVSASGARSTAGGVRILPVYGGQSIQTQLRRLHSGVHIVVGTPGRIMDHLRRGTLDLSDLKVVVLDEADEMLKMGFIEDVEWILGQAPEGVQKALFSATMPAEVRRIAERYLREPATVEIEHKTLTVENTEQRYLIVSDSQKLDALTHVLETETAPEVATLIFAGTKLRAAELAEKLLARGYAAEAMHGDMNQPQRENVIRRLRSGQLEIVTATDVAARGWDVERIGLVVNYDIPYDTEAYVHRIGRTGRAGRSGKAILFVTPRQKRILRDIERFTGQRIQSQKVPTRADVAARRTALFKQRLLLALEGEELDLYLTLVEELANESGRDMAEIAAAAARLARGDKPLEIIVEPVVPEGTAVPEDGVVRLFIDAGRQSGVRPADIVGAIANEADVPGKLIGPIDIYDRFSLVGVPAQYLQQVLERMDGATIRSRDARMRVATRKEADEAPPPRRGFIRDDERRGPGSWKGPGKRPFKKPGKPTHRRS